MISFEYVKGKDMALLLFNQWNYVLHTRKYVRRKFQEDAKPKRMETSIQRL